MPSQAVPEAARALAKLILLRRSQDTVDKPGKVSSGYDLEYHWQLRHCERSHGAHVVITDSHQDHKRNAVYCLFMDGAEVVAEFASQEVVRLVCVLTPASPAFSSAHVAPSHFVSLCSRKHNTSHQMQHPCPLVAPQFRMGHANLRHVVVVAIS